MTKLLELPIWVERRRAFSVYSDFTRLPPLQSFSYRTSNQAADGDIANTVFFAPDRLISVQDVEVFPDGSAAGVDDANTLVLSVNDGTNNLVSKTYNTTVTFPATKTRASLGTVGFGTVPSTGFLALKTVAGTNAVTPNLVWTVEYYDLAQFPDADFQVLAPQRGVASVNTTAIDGIAVLTPTGSAAAAANDEIYLVSRSSPFVIQQDQPILVEGRFQFAEASTNNAVVAFGLMSAVGALSIQDGTAGPKTSFSGAVVWKRAGDTAWRTLSSVGSTQVANQAAADFTPSDGAWHTYRIEIRPIDGTTADVCYFVDGQQLRPSSAAVAVFGIKDRITYTGALAMQCFVCVKNGSANAETLNVDYLGAAQQRYNTGLYH